MIPSPQHCDHECVCWFAHGGMKPDGMFIHPCRIPCKHDTRSRPSPASTSAWRDNVKKIGQEWLQQHDAAIVAAARKEERERVISRILEIEKNRAVECPKDMKAKCDRDEFTGTCIECVCESLLTTPSAPEQEK